MAILFTEPIILLTSFWTPHLLRRYQRLRWSLPAAPDKTTETETALSLFPRQAWNLPQVLIWPMRHHILSFHHPKPLLPGVPLFFDEPS
jgi:hypothetical protein